MRKYTYILLLLFLAVSANAQKSAWDEIKEDVCIAGGGYCSYPYPRHEVPKLTPAPKGYKPFYMSHYGRHGSRWLHDPAQYSNSAIKILTHDPDLDDERNGFKEGVDSTKAFRSYFISDYDARKIAAINAKVNELGKSKKDGSVAKLAALAAVLFTKKVLSKTYKETLTYLFSRFNIKEDPSAYKPAQFRA